MLASLASPISINEGSLIGFQPMTADAKTFFADRVHSEPWQWMGPTLWAKRRMTDMLAIAITAEGLTMEGVREKVF